MDADYVISAAIVAQDYTGGALAGIGQGVARIERRLNGLGSLISGIGRSFGAIAGAAGLGAMLSGIVGINSGLDEAQRGMAALFTAFSGSPIEKSFGRARGVVKDLASDAKKGVGELANYVEGFQKIFGATGGNASDTAVRSLTRNALAAGFALRGNEGLQLAPMDIAQALSGGVSRTETPIVMTALQAIGVTSQKFNAMKMPEKLETLDKAFASFGPGVELMGKSWSAQFSTMTDNLKDFARNVTAPLFERWIELLRRANSWLEKNSDKITDIAKNIGTKLAQAWDLVLGRMREAAMLSATIGVVQVVSGASGSLPASLGKLAGLRDEGGRFRSATWADFASKQGLSKLATGGASAAGGALMSAGPMLLLAGVVAGAMAALYEALNQYPELVGVLSRDFGKLTADLGMLGNSFERLFGFFPDFSGILAAVGTGLAMFIDGLIILADDVVKIATFLTRLMEGVMDSMRMHLDVGQAVLAGDFTRARALALTNGQLGRARLAYAFSAFGGAKDAGAPAVGDGLDKPPVTNNNNNFNGPITINVKAEVNEDPARVAYAVGEFLEHVDRYKKQPRRPVRPPGM
jgi:hypothetical protein